MSNFNMAEHFFITVSHRGRQICSSCSSNSRLASRSDSSEFCSREICSVKLSCEFSLYNDSDTLLCLVPADGDDWDAESDNARLRYVSKSSVSLRSRSNMRRSRAALDSASAQLSSPVWFSTADSFLTVTSSVLVSSSAAETERRCFTLFSPECATSSFCLRFTADLAGDTIGLRSSEITVSYKLTAFHYITQQLETCKTAKRPQAPGDATVRKRFFHDNFVIFRRRSKRIAFGISEFFYVCLYATFQFS